MATISVPSCSAEGCAGNAVVGWARLMTADELAVWQAANPDGDLTAIQAVTAEFGCVNHQLSLDLATMLHQSTCSAPNVANLPQCDCAPQTYGVPA